MDYQRLQDLILEIVNAANASGYLEYSIIYNNDIPMGKKYTVEFILAEDIFGELMAKHILNNPSDYFKQSNAHFETILGIHYKVDKNLPKGTINLTDSCGKDLIISNVFSGKMRII